MENPQGIGASVRRKEDRRFLTGRGRYVGDLAQAGELHAVFLRSPLAHARVAVTDVAEALAVPGVAVRPQQSGVVLEFRPDARRLRSGRLGQGGRFRRDADGVE